MGSPDPARKPPGVSFDTWIETAIRDAQDRGEFDNLPGAGKPLPGRGFSADENWWIREKLRREGISATEMMPPPLRLRKEVVDLPRTAADAPTEQAVREIVTELNDRIRQWRRIPVGPPLHVPLADEEAIIEQWRADRAAGLAAAQPTAPSAPARRRVRWWKRAWHRTR